MQRKFVFKSLYSSDILDKFAVNDVHRLSYQLGRLPGSVLESVKSIQVKSLTNFKYTVSMQNRKADIAMISSLLVNK